MVSNNPDNSTDSLGLDGQIRYLGDQKYCPDSQADSLDNQKYIR